MYSRPQRIHPLIYPEYYKVFTHNQPYVVKSLYVSSDSSIFPTVLTDTPTNIIDSIFIINNYQLLSFNDFFHLYYDPFSQINYKNTNYIITSFLRNYYLTNYGEKLSTPVYGDVLLFGSKDLQTNTIDGKDHSVPYMIVEEIISLYAKEQIF